MLAWRCRVNYISRSGSRRQSRESFNFRGLNASIFVLFIFSRFITSRGFQFFTLQFPETKFKGCSCAYNGDSYNVYEYMEGHQSQQAI